MRRGLGDLSNIPASAKFLRPARGPAQQVRHPDLRAEREVSDTLRPRCFGRADGLALDLQ